MQEEGIESPRAHHAHVGVANRATARPIGLLRARSSRKAVVCIGMDAGDAMERGELSPLLPESHGSKIQDDTLQVPLIRDKKRTGSKAPAVVLGFECLESTAFNGISTNLVVYLETVLHGSNLASASNVTTWYGTSFLTPIFGAIIADTFWGNYNTILVSLAVYLLGMMLVTFSAFLPTATELGGTSVFGAQTIVFIGLYLVAVGSGGVRSSLLPFGAEQFDDDNAVDRERKASFFSLFYLCIDFGPIVSGIFIVWIQENVSWGLGFGISTACIALAFGAFVLATPMYKRRMPTGTPLKSLCQVVVAACRKIGNRVPTDVGMLHEVSDKVDSQPKIAHTSEFTFLDKAAIISESDLEEISEEVGSSWKLCTVTQVEELKILLRLLPVWTTSIIVSAAYSQMNTTFIQQGSAMDMSILSVPVPAASMGSFEVVCVLTWVLLYSKVIVPALRGLSGGDGEPSQLQRMGAGRLLMALTMAVAALVEMKRLDSAARAEAIGIAWQIPQYFFLAGAEVFCYIAQLEFFYTEAPDTMKSTCTSLALLTIALGSYMSSLIYAIVAAFTATAESPGWISDDLNQGHLDYFFWTMAAMCTLNLVVYSSFAKNYKLKTVLS
ncbi:protein NRT1/ PTR FAMILY 8.3-like [Phragmites australis]|uniref:protein NRT1/ PTR FAMILY 8.3-like n=1 Tax=Phragmites australis TaxID=29695 RepID=UPI002D7980F4|nr:protein NRT1/ PTR FAMILY 8.3-like [Phragmites australis]